jgi:predicted neutral ceramidase superfamily lipid hydrolase
MIQNSLSQIMNCVVQVPHGLSGHELDLTSQTQNERVLDTLLNSMEFPPFQSGITPLVRKQIDDAKASCQIFGDCAFLTLTVAPKTMEDLSQDLDSAILKEAKRQGLSSAIVIDAHNSINGSFDPVATTEDLKKVAEAALREALILPNFSFEVGTSNITPTDLSIEDGLGPGGLNALVLKVSDQRLAYITIDGNNMVSGLREEVFRVIQENGITEGEIFTTDSHTVNGVIISERGYRPVGEIKKRRIIEYIRQAVTTALNNLEETRVSWRTITIPNIKTIGEGQIKKLTFVIEEVAKKAKRFAYLIFPTASIISTVFLVFL